MYAPRESRPREGEKAASREVSMTDQEAGSEEPAIVLVLPTWNGVLGGYGCAREWAQYCLSFFCACPKCLAEKGMTLVFDPEDFETEGLGRQQWRRYPCSEKLARLVPERIVPGYPGAEFTPEG